MKAKLDNTSLADSTDMSTTEILVGGTDSIKAAKNDEKSDIITSKSKISIIVNF